MYKKVNMAILKEGAPFPIVEVKMSPEELLSLIGDPRQVAHALSKKREEAEKHDPLPNTRLILPKH